MLTTKENCYTVTKLFERFSREHWYFLMKKFIPAFAVKIGFLVFPFHGLASADPSCRLEFLSLDDKSSVEFVDILPLKANDSAAIRNRLDLSQNTGTASLEVEQPMNPEIAMKLYNFLIMHPEVYLRDFRKGSIVIPPSAENYWKKQLSKSFSKVEINQIERELERYFDQIAKTILSVDDKAIEVTHFFIRTDKDFTPTEHDHGSGFEGGFTWISTTHAIFGPGTWYETTYNGKLKKTNTKTGETLVLSENYRNRTLFHGKTCSLCTKSHPAYLTGALHGAPDTTSGKRLILIASYQLVQLSSDK